MAVSTQMILDTLTKVNGSSPVLKSVTLNALNALFNNDDNISKKITNLIMESLNNLSNQILLESKILVSAPKPVQRQVIQQPPQQSRYQPDMNKLAGLFNDDPGESILNESSAPQVPISKDNPAPAMPKNAFEQQAQSDLFSKLDSLLF